MNEHNIKDILTNTPSVYYTLDKKILSNLKILI